MDMRIKLNKWGNSWAVRLPGTYLKELGISQNEIVDLSLEKDKIVLKKVNAGIGGKYKLADLLSSVKPASLHGEVWSDTNPSGNEQW